MDETAARPSLGGLVGVAILAMAFGPPTRAIVVVGGDHGWEVSFDGNVGGFYINQDPDSSPANVAPETLFTFGAIESDDDESRVRSGLLPSFFSFNVTSPTVIGLTGSARVSFAPVIQNDNRKNDFALTREGQSGSSIDMREAFFDVEGTFGTFSIGRALSLFQRENYLTDMSLFGVGAGGDAGGQITLGHSGYGYLYPNYNARFAYRTPDVWGFNVEVGMFDPSEIQNDFINVEDDFINVEADKTDTPRFEGEASYAATFSGGALKAWINGLWQGADFESDCGLGAAECAAAGDVTAWGIGGGAQVGFDTGWGNLELTGSGYRGNALGSTLILDEDALDPTGRERRYHGWLAQGTWILPNVATKFGFNYGKSEADETAFERSLRNTSGIGNLEEQHAWTIGVYHDVTDWLKLVGEYSQVEREWFNGEDQDNDIFSIGGFFSW